eukprot:CAMPEP_0201284752 /NCGR_PEP_ID=MMETSP1317-20130820/83690_1 /ASSEMBLY_ACC=CAM_ASM_000770 /TAXON_ID=187299 /ORGANISM="Undescribed Undescribed, Strain Undescribed" /LENGTH=34 /DNA_ID= /DNA_START= /DNA_END= /DNA_ORIENTATION=
MMGGPEKPSSDISNLELTLETIYAYIEETPSRDF